MKIIVNGKIIDTENIYSISSKVMEGVFDYRLDGLHIYFTIESLNGKSESVLLPKPTFDDALKLAKQIPGYLEGEIYDKQLSEVKTKIKELQDNLLNDARAKVEAMRLDIEKVWLDGQTTLQSFDIKNY